MTGREFIVGNVTDVFDGETIRLTVERIGGKKEHAFNDQEKIRIKKLRLTDIAWMTGVFTKPQIEKMFKGRQVLCLVKSRDQGGKIVADVQLI